MVLQHIHATRFLHDQFQLSCANERKHLDKIEALEKAAEERRASVERLQARCEKLILDLDKADSLAAEEMRLKDEAEERVRVLRRQLGTEDEPGSAILEAIQ